MRPRVLFMQNVHGNAVGAGVGLAIHAMQKSEALNTPESYVHFCIKAAQEAYDAVMSDPPAIKPKRGSMSAYVIALRSEQGEPSPEYESGESLKAMAREAATVAFRACMPQVTGRRKTQAYIACVAAGMQLKYITGAEGKSLLYSAQLALAASRPSRAR